MWHFLLIPNIPNCDLEPIFAWMDTKLITPVLCSANFVPDLYSVKPFWLSWQMISATGITILSCFQARNMEGILDIFLFWSLGLIYQQVLSIFATKQLSNPPISLHCYYYPGPCHLLPSLEYCKTLLTGLAIFTMTPLQSILFPASRTIFTKHMWSPNSTALGWVKTTYDSPWDLAWSSLTFLFSLLLYQENLFSHHMLIFYSSKASCSLLSQNSLPGNSSLSLCLNSCPHPQLSAQATLLWGRLSWLCIWPMLQTSLHC